MSPQAEMLSYAQTYRPDAVLVMNGLHTFPANQKVPQAGALANQARGAGISR